MFKQTARAIFLLTVLACPVAAQDQIKTVRYATAEWLNFTNRDGTGLYHELFREIFGIMGAEVDVTYMPLNRAVSMVEAGQMDVTGGFTRDDRVFAVHPIFETTYTIIYRSDMDVDWDDPNVFDTLRIVGPPAIQAEVAFDMIELDSRSQAGKMLVSGRADGYIDLVQLIETFRDTGKTTDVDDVTGDEVVTFDINPDDWRLRNVKSSRLYMLFTDSPRGRQIRDLYDDGTEKLFASGVLGEIYEKFNVRAPLIEPR